MSSHDQLGNFFGHESNILSLAPSPNGHYLVTSSEDRTVRLWNLRPAN